MDKHLIYINEAIRLAVDNVSNGGGPFGAVIVKDGEIIARSANTVTQTNDPTAHAEVNAIRETCRRLETFHLEGCVIYSSCEPCPMCLSAIYWARISEVYYAATREDAAESGFDDSLIYDEITKPPGKRIISFIQMKVDEMVKPFRIWQEYEDKTRY
ncbi:nucleoside deaminase [Parabacteroides sp. FAFU027]|uniref:nucleoside deaminase n=1 Tax=Parabacteroides sp. FAFU027 TaxID=2922715 RepID=UPI001FB04A70|nr:nucleoside deaminase [Parabacteroides sp. FAFU027]